ncbi:MAG: septal ring lytic transglycosylase RlpA family protein [Desulfobacteraceae bacterium]|nr:septal ring lytic transglycosylase RlpA family protein [Desulfobacteraceae bacterium]
MAVKFAASRILIMGFTVMLIMTCCGSKNGEKKNESYQEVGVASYYSDPFHGRKTASGERYNQYAMTAAHQHLPFGTHVRVTNLQNGRWVIVRINDRGPFAKGRIIDLSYSAAKKLRIANKGTAKVRIEVIRK